MKILTLGLWMMVCVLLPHAAQADWNLMPQPAQITSGQGKLKIDESFRVALTGYREPRLERAAQRLIVRIELLTGIPVADVLASNPSEATLEIATSGASAPVQKLGEDESYRLSITPAHARLEAANPLGALHGMETFLQLVEADQASFSVPAVEINDRPRFAWRGTMLDVSRHWMPVEVVLRTLNAMAAVKLNVFHWHLSDDQGFRVESKRFPKLQELGSDGHFYTQPQVREVIEYARDRGIRVVPEFDMPGHATAWFVGYPELASAPGPYSIERHWGIFDPAMDPTRDETYQFLDGLIAEMTALFPDEYFHIGGDEVNGKQWTVSPRIQAFMRDHNMKNTEELQSYFSRQVVSIVTKYGKKVIGWDEVLSPDLPKGTVIQSWRGQKSLAEAAHMGFAGILSAPYYLDLMHSAADHYAGDPLEKESATLSPEEKSLILGGESCMWVEYATPANVDMKIWPRNAAIAERLWSPEEVKDVSSMYRRLAAVSREFDLRGIPHEREHHLMLERLAGPHPGAPLSTLSDVLEPVKDYSREESGHDYTSFTPLNRLVDATRPESTVARDFSIQVDQFLAGGPAASASRDELRLWLTHWRANDAALEPTLADSFLLQEVVPLSKDLADVSSAGLEALDYLAGSNKPDREWLARQHALLDSAAKPRAELLLMIVPAIGKLVDAAANRP
jgi:hexosaminidase